MTQLIQDVFIIENLQVLSEGKGNGKTVVKGIFGRCNETNKNGRMYPTAVLEGQLEKVQPLINERRLCGELDHPSNDTVKLANASHLITKLEMKGDELIGEAEILGTPAGLTAKALIEAGVCIGISSRGMGTLSEDAKGNKVVNDDFRLVTFDLVADPSTRGAFPALAESTESRFARTSQSKLKKEQNFVTMLQDKLRESYDPWIEEAKKGKKKGKKKGSFPDLNKDGEITKADILVGRGVIPGKKMKSKKMKMEAVKAEGSWHQIAYTLAEGLDLVEGVDDPNTAGGGDTKPFGKGVGHRIKLANAERRKYTARRKADDARRKLKGTSVRGAISAKLAKKINPDTTTATSTEDKPETPKPKTARRGLIQRLKDRFKKKDKASGSAPSETPDERSGKGASPAPTSKNVVVVKPRKKPEEDEKPTRVRAPGTFGAGVPEATAYKQIGFQLAEALGLIGEDQKETDVRDTRRKKAGMEIARRDDLHRTRTGQSPRPYSRLDQKGMPQPGMRTPKQWRDPRDPKRK